MNLILLEQSEELKNAISGFGFYLRRFLRILVITKRIWRRRELFTHEVMTSYTIRIRDSGFVTLRNLPTISFSPNDITQLYPVLVKRRRFLGMT